MASVMRDSYWLKACLLIGITAMLFAGYQAYSLIESRNAIVRNAKQTAQFEAATAASEIDRILQQSAVAVDALAENLSSGVLAEEGLDGHLKATIEREQEILTVGVAYDPSTLGRLHAPAITRRGESRQSLLLEDRQDYTSPGVLWYTDAILEGKGWRKPSWSETEETMTVVYSAPFRRSGAGDPSPPAGVVFASLSLDRIGERVDELETGRLGWGGILSKEGRYLVHPNEQRVEDPSTLLEVLEARR